MPRVWKTYEKKILCESRLKHNSLRLSRRWLKRKSSQLSISSFTASKRHLWCERSHVPLNYSCVWLEKIWGIARNTNRWSHPSPAAVVNTVSHSGSQACARLRQREKKPEGERRFHLFFYALKKNTSVPLETINHTLLQDLPRDSEWVLRFRHTSAPPLLSVGSRGKGWMTQCKKCVIWPFLLDLCLPPPSLHTLITHSSATEYH